MKKENVELWTSKAGPMLIYTGYERKPLCALKGGKKKRREKENKKKKYRYGRKIKRESEAFHVCINANISHHSAYIKCICNNLN